MSPARPAADSRRRLVRSTKAGQDRGAVSLELVVLTPVLIAILALVIVAGRIVIAGNSVEQAADEAARSASISRTARGAYASAISGARSVLARQGLQCSSLNVVLDVAGFAVPAGEPAQVRATVTCVVRLSDVGMPGWPGTRTVTASAVSPLDTYRGRSS